jgi:hypothetical protein
MLLLKVLYFSTENETGLYEVRKIDVPVTDLNNEDCEETEDNCELDKIYYFIIGECIHLLYRVIVYVIFIYSYRIFLLNIFN